MGKVRIKTFDESGIEELEGKKKAKREAKKVQKKQEKEVKIQKDSQKKVEEKKEKKKADAPKTEEINPPAGGEAKEEKKEVSAEDEKPKKQKKEKFIKEKIISARITSNQKLVSKNQSYPIDKAVNLLSRFETSKFDETVELHLNVHKKGLSGSLSLPHGSGKAVRIRVADDVIVAQIESGKIDFDVLVATPDMMPKLAKVARILGPRGLMPNPKNGTITDNPDEVVKKLSGGEMNYKTESKAPIIHLLIGKISFGEKKILENAKKALEAIGEDKIKSATLASTMSPGIKLQVSEGN